MSTIFQKHHGLNKGDPRGPQIIYGLCPGCHNWQIDYIDDCGPLRDMLDEALEQHVKDCEGKFYCYNELAFDFFYIDCNLDARDQHTDHEGSGTDDNGFEYEVKWHKPKEVSTDRAIPTSEGSS